ncbi:hypothetical protein HBI15_029140 [Parastagonospora nodorum]|nr:hypothetical protein HBI15_029140 [Parastagonospora nodorum]
MKIDTKNVASNKLAVKTARPFSRRRHLGLANISIRARCATPSCSCNRDISNRGIGLVVTLFTLYSKRSRQSTVDYESSKPILEHLSYFHRLSDIIEKKPSGSDCVPPLSILFGVTHV